MTDRELLEMAAKAARVPGSFIEKCPEDGHPTYSCGIGKAGQLHSLWNPLNDDGDALRLAVTLGVRIETFPTWIYTRARYPGQESWNDVVEPHNEDKFQATRRAIVRAAAEIGASR